MKEEREQHNDDDDDEGDRGDKVERRGESKIKRLRGRGARRADRLIGSRRFFAFVFEGINDEEKITMPEAGVGLIGERFFRGGSLGYWVARDKEGESGV